VPPRERLRTRYVSITRRSQESRELHPTALIIGVFLLCSTPQDPAAGGAIQAANGGRSLREYSPVCDRIAQCIQSANDAIRHKHLQQPQWTAALQHAPIQRSVFMFHLRLDFNPAERAMIASMLLQ